jgi:hypothetical protein
MIKEKKPVQEEPVKPMAVEEPTLMEEVTALKLRVNELEHITNKHQRYHFAGVSKE